VVSDPHARRLVGLVSRSDLIKPSLEIGDHEHRVERFFTLPLGAARARFRSLTDAPESRNEDR